MNQIQNITEPQPYLTLLPENEDVFAPDSAFLTKHLLPLVSIDLSAVNPEWRGKIHLVNPIEPHDCYIGSYTEEFHNEFAAENWFLLQLDENNHYQWLGNREYFYLENPDCDKYLKKQSQEMYADYKLLKQHFIETGKIINQLHINDADISPCIFIERLGGEASRSNWHTPINRYFHVTHINIDIDEEITIHDFSGLKYNFIASVAGWNYCIHGPDTILMFYQPETKRVLFTFDWT